jgi:lipoprotein-anchoring transpeptidase ErfK/SrfK
MIARTVIAAAAFVAMAAPASAATNAAPFPFFFLPGFQQVEPVSAPAYAPQAREFQPRATQPTREIVAFEGGYGAGTVVVNTRERRLYYVLGGGKAVRYSIGVGREGFQWAGAQRISNKQAWPDWRPPAEMLKRRPDLPRYMAGGPANPLGARAMYLGGSLYRIHGSNEPETIGQAVSSGCIRMLNEDVVDLYDRVRVGTQVVVLR